MSIRRLPLAGHWRRLIQEREIDTVRVPGWYPPVGECVLEHRFERPWAEDGNSRSFLCTEGVLARAVFSLNGRPVGEAGPWSGYRFELPPGSLQDDNVLQARIGDIGEYFGPTPGRRFDAGLVRAIFLERRPRTFLESVAFRYELSHDWSAADCTVTVQRSGESAEPVEIVLAERTTGRVVASARADGTEPARFQVEWPHLWSPEMPQLYTLRATLSGPYPETVEEMVGFRRITVEGPDFFLNGSRLLLKGVCRHEFTSASGYSPPEAEVRRDMALIRHAGFNYVRLVHSPQAACVSRAAAEVGLLVSEEPGTCFHDLADERVVEPALECLTRMVTRDRNIPSVFAWLLYNECNPNTDFAVRAAEICRGLDPGRLLGMADCSGQDDAIKEMVHTADLSFYGINVYTFWPGDFRRKMETFTDRPLVFTEWGGWIAQGNPRVRKDLCDTFVRHSRPEQPLRTAGFSFWAWADYEEYSRDQPAAIEGWTVEGLIDKTGRPKEDLLALSMACFEMDCPPDTPAPPVEILSPGPARPDRWQAIPLDGVAGDQSAAEQAIEALRSRYAERPPELGRLLAGGIEFLCRDAAGRARPLLLGPGRDELFIPIDRTVTAIAVLGHVALQGGYPASSTWSVHHRDAEPVKALGAEESSYELVFDDGETRLPLRHGIEILRANNICRWWKSGPRAPQTRPVVQTVVHPSYEILRLDLWEHTLPGPRRLAGLRWRLTDPESIQALFALSVLAVG